MADETAKIADFWSQYEPLVDAGNFYGSPLTRPYIIETAYGEDLVAEYQDDSNFAEDIFIAKYLKGKKVEHILSLCCGYGIVERTFAARLPHVKECLGLDIAEGALEVARRRAADEGLGNISYEYADLNNYSWENDNYDLVIANGALHHLRNLERVAEGIHRTLKRDGILYACEYVGPSYQDHPPRQLQIINAVAYLVPDELRNKNQVFLSGRGSLAVFMSRLQSISNRRKPGWPAWKDFIADVLRIFFRTHKRGFDFEVVHLSPKEHLQRTDPSESVRSADIIPVLKEQFHNIEVRPFGGGILMHALGEDFYANFDKKNPLHLKCLLMLFQLEHHFMSTGEIGIENAFIVARKT